MEFEIRHATLDDGEDLLNLWHGFTDHLSEYDERYKHKESADERWLDYFSNQLVDSKYGTVIVAEGDGKILGVLEARVMGNHPIFRLKNHGKITGHYVREGYRREGVGSAMIEEAEEWFRSPPREVDFFRINIIEGDTGSEEMYRDQGFYPVEHVYEKKL